jgi:two-component system, OmpR family, sensor kinase
MTGGLRRLARRLIAGPRRTDPPLSGEMLVLRTLCHELRPPVSTLGALLRALDAGAGPDTDGLARLAVAHTRHLDELLRQAAGLADGLRDEADDDADAAALSAILPEVTATVPPGRLELRVSDAAADCLVHARRTRQILINLLGNAVRHGPRDGRITLLARARGTSLLLTVHDEGAMTAELDHALRRGTAPAGMHGLGLWLVRQLVRHDGGSVHARPVSPGGVAVCARLPRRDR